MELFPPSPFRAMRFDCLRPCVIANLYARGNREVKMLKARWLGLKEAPGTVYPRPSRAEHFEASNAHMGAWGGNTSDRDL